MRIKALKKHQAELLGYGHFNVVALCQLQGCFDGEDAFCDGVGGLEDVIELFASGEPTPELLVAAQGTGTGRHKVTNPSESGEGERIRSRCCAQARDFGEAARDEGGF